MRDGTTAEQKAGPEKAPGDGGPLLGLHREPVWLHGVALAVLALGAFVRFDWWLSFPGPLLPDELTYFRAFRLVLDGESPYQWGGYLYPPLFAWAGAELWQHLGRGGLLTVLRIGNLAGLVVTVWCAMVWLPLRWHWRVGVGMAVIALSPAVVQGLTFGNLSLWVAGMMVLGLFVWSRYPVTAGLLLGASVAIKPLAPPAILVLGAHRPRGRGSRQVLAAGVAMAAAVGLLLAFPGFFEWLELARRASTARSVSWHRFPAIFGFEPNHLLVTGLVMAVVLMVARWRCWSRLYLACLALVAVMAATPLVWNHTLVATLPLQVLAVGVLARRWRREEGAAPRGRFYEGVVVILAVASLHLATGANTIDDQPVWLQLLGAGVPALAPGALLAYVVLLGDPGSWQKGGEPCVSSSSTTSLQRGDA